MSSFRQSMDLALASQVGKWRLNSMTYDGLCAWRILAVPPKEELAEILERAIEVYQQWDRASWESDKYKRQREFILRMLGLAKQGKHHGPQSWHDGTALWGFGAIMGAIDSLGSAAQLASRMQDPGDSGELPYGHSRVSFMWNLEHMCGVMLWCELPNTPYARITLNHDEKEQLTTDAMTSYFNRMYQIFNQKTSYVEVGHLDVAGLSATRPD